MIDGEWRWRGLRCEVFERTRFRVTGCVLAGEPCPSPLPFSVAAVRRGEGFQGPVLPACKLPLLALAPVPRAAAAGALALLGPERSWRRQRYSRTVS